MPPGYSLGADMFALDEVKGGSPWGASTFAGGDNSREVSEKERKYALHQVGTAGEAAGWGGSGKTARTLCGGSGDRGQAPSQAG